MEETKPKSKWLGKLMIGIVIAGTLIIVYLTIKLFVVSQISR